MAEISKITSQLLPGITLHGDGRISPNKQEFESCCGFRGLSFDPARGAVCACSLGSRLASLDTLCRQFRQIWPKAPLALLCPSLQAQFLSWLQTYNSRPVGLRGRLLHEVGHGPSALWHLAFALVWRAGLGVHVVHLERSQRHQILPRASSPSQYPQVVLVEGGASLWTPEYANHLSCLITWCDLAAVPLWLSLTPPRESSTRSLGATRMPLPNNNPRFRRARERVGAVQGRDPLTWIDPATRSRLASICQLGPKLRPLSS